MPYGRLGPRPCMHLGPVARVEAGPRTGGVPPQCGRLGSTPVRVAHVAPPQSVCLFRPLITHRAGFVPSPLLAKSVALGAF